MIKPLHKKIMQDKKIKLSVIIPAYNEEERSLKKGVLDEIYSYLNKADFPYEVIIVDDESTDGTAKEIERQIKDKKYFSLLKSTHGGKAISIMRGLMQAKGEINLFIDMDQSTPLSEVEKFFPRFTQGYDIVIGSRDGREGAPIIRRVASVIFAALRNIILGLPFSDTQCGFKACNSKTRDLIFPKMLDQWSKQQVTGYTVSAGFDVEFLFRAKKSGLKIIDVPVNWHYVGNERYQLVKNALSALKDMMKIRWQDFRGIYNS